MGNTPSKDGKKSDDARSISSGTGPSLDSYPSFSKSDTRESARSFRGSIRSKIPGSGKLDSPRSTTPNPSRRSGSVERDVPIDRTVSQASNSTGGDASGTATPTQATQEASGTSGPLGRLDLPVPDPYNEEVPQPPPSPSQSTSIGQGHSSIDRAQRSGEVDHVSDAPPTGTIHPSHNQQPGESILAKKKAPPRTIDKWFGRDSVSSNTMEIGALKSVDLDEMIQRLLDAGYAGKVTKAPCLKNAEITAICQAAKEVFLSQPGLLYLNPPVKIVGDIHGQYTDLIRMFEMCGFPPTSNYLFLGDYVDRGKQSLETILLLLCYKLKFPENFFLLRGNHESANVTRVYGFYDECKRRTNVKIWKTFIDTFNTLPLAAVVANKIFCVHGGLSPSLQHLEDIENITRPTDVPDYGLLNDLLWSDPADMEADWESNERGVSYCFGKKVIMNFLHKFDLDLVCRAHMVVEDGYEFFNDRVLVTVFSAPNVSFVCSPGRVPYTDVRSTVESLIIGVQSCLCLANCCAASSCSSHSTPAL